MALPIVLGALGGIGGVAGLFSGFMQASAARKAGEANYRLGMLESMMLQQSATTALQQGAFEAGQIRTMGASLMGEQRVAIGGSGLAATSSSALAALQTTEAMSAADAAQTEYNALLQAWGLTAQATARRAQAYQDRAAGRAAAAGHMLSGIGSAVSAGAGVVGRFI